MSKLPTLPEAVHGKIFLGSSINGKWVDIFTEIQMREYGQQCRDAALDEVATSMETLKTDLPKMGGTTPFLNYTSTLLSLWVAAIRSMK